MTSSLSLRYGANPQQAPARVFMPADADLPISVLNGSPGYINLLDALNAWQLVRELKSALNLPAAASFKHVSPAGVAVANPLSDVLKKSYFVDDELSPLATAYARARGADRLCSFGDFIALSDTVDVPTAKLIAREVSDGVIAPAYEPAALEILKAKKQGKYAVVQIDPSYDPASEQEIREVFGVRFEQHRHDRLVTPADFTNIVTTKKDLPESAIRDLTIAWITLKYTQSNSVCFVVDGQAIGVGAGQQSRIHCVRLAGQKADLWFLRQHPTVLDLPFKPGTKRPDRDNAIDQFLRDDVTKSEKADWDNIFVHTPRQLTLDEKQQWLSKLDSVTLGSDAFFPFRDSIDRAAVSGVKYVLEPGGSTRDNVVIQAANDYGMTMIFSGIRLFHH